MRYKDELNVLFRKYSDEFICEEDVLIYLFCPNEDCYKWQDGQLVRSPIGLEYVKQNICTQEEVARVNAIALNKRLSAYEYDTSCGWRPKRNYTWTKLKSGNLVRSHHISTWNRPPLQSIPDDIQDDWLAAAREACKIARQIYPKVHNTRYAREAEARIKAILAARKAANDHQ